jgi:hypothetical protein
MREEEKGEGWDQVGVGLEELPVDPPLLDCHSLVLPIGAIAVLPNGGLHQVTSPLTPAGYEPQTGLTKLSGLGVVPRGIRERSG